MKILGILTWIGVSVLGGMKASWGIGLWKGQEISLSKVWQEKQMYVLSGICFLLYGILWIKTGERLVSVRLVDLAGTYGILALVDGKRKIVPGQILVFYFAGQMLLGALGTVPEELLYLVFTGLLFAGVLFIFVWISGRKMGMGDVQLLGVTAMTAGWAYTLQILILAMGFSFFYSICLLLFFKKGIRTEFPFVPFLAAGVAVQMVSQGLIT